MMKLALLAFCAVLPGAIADAGDCTVADYAAIGACDDDADCTEPTLSTTCDTCFTDAGITENSTDEDIIAALLICAPAPARDMCTTADIGADEADLTDSCGVCLFVAVAASIVDGNTEEEAGIIAIGVCGPTPANGQCVVADYTALDDEDDATEASDACGVCAAAAAVDAALADNDITEEAAEAAAMLACMPAAAAGQCTAAEATAGAAYIAALPCDGDGTTAATAGDDSDDCPTTEFTKACELCMLMTGGLSDPPTGAQLTAAMAVCDPAAATSDTTDTTDKASGTAGLVASLALASVAAVTQL